MGLFRVGDSKLIGLEFDPSSFEMVFSFLEYKVVGKKTKGMLTLCNSLSFYLCPCVYYDSFDAGNRSHNSHVTQKN